VTVTRTRQWVAPGVLIVSMLLAGGCGGGDPAPAVSVVIPVAPPALVSPNGTQVAIVGVPFSYDATKGNTAFSDPRSRGLTYTVSVSAATWLSAAAGRLTGAPDAPGVATVTIIATDVSGATATNTFSVVAFAGGLPSPSLPAASFAYSDADSPLPPHFGLGNINQPGPGGPVLATDNTPSDNRTTNAGATLGRVLFYDTRLSANDRTACASCHQQAFAFGDTARLSRGFQGGNTGRHSMALGNARFYQRGRAFWDERAASLEAQALQPIQDATEMGLTLEKLVLKVGATNYYPPLFQAAFGTPEVTSDRIAKALAQFVRSLVSYQSKFDRAFVGNGPPNFAAVFTDQELEGQQLFNGTAACARCHATNAQVSDNIHNTGLPQTAVPDTGAGGGRFKAPSLRNVAVRTPYMHDGRFTTLLQVVEHYDNGVQQNPNLDQRLRGPNGAPLRLNLTSDQKAALVAYMNTLTDSGFVRQVKFSDPFAP
jgi:cytochrome c peroxidase